VKSFRFFLETSNSVQNVFVFASSSSSSSIVLLHLPHTATLGPAPNCYRAARRAARSAVDTKRASTKPIGKCDPRDARADAARGAWKLFPSPFDEVSKSSVAVVAIACAKPAWETVPKRRPPPPDLPGPGTPVSAPREPLFPRKPFSLPSPSPDRSPVPATSSSPSVFGKNLGAPSVPVTSERHASYIEPNWCCTAATTTAAAAMRAMTPHMRGGHTSVTSG
jgi:hypothetical protein